VSGGPDDHGRYGAQPFRARSERTRGEASLSLSVEASLRDLSTAYADAVDRRDGERFARLFVPDGMLVVPRSPDELAPTVIRQGHDQLRSVPDGLRRYVRTFHRSSDHGFAVDPSVTGTDLAGVVTAAVGTVSCVAHHLLATGSERAGSSFVDRVWFLRYSDRYRLDGGSWRFAERVLHLQWVEEHPVSAVGPGLAPTDHPTTRG